MVDRRVRARVSARGCIVALAIGSAIPVWVHGVTERVSLGPRDVQGNNGSVDPSISADGRFVAFDSGASNLVPRDTNGQSDVYVRILAP